MKSRAQIKSHPIHPILVSFPIAFFTGTLVFDCMYQIADNSSFNATAKYLNIAGVSFAVLAAIAGFIDYLYTVPPESSAKKRATKHALINSTVLIIFIVALVLRSGAGSFIIIALEVIAVALMMVAGWLGGTLVHRNQIGIDIRYANAGKWKEIYLDKSLGEIEVEDVAGLKLNQMILIHANDKRIVLGKTEQGFTAFDDRCPHKGGSLAGGAMICGTVQCPWHGSQFDVTTGALKAGPGKSGIKTYPVTESAGKVTIRLS